MIKQNYEFGQIGADNLKEIIRTGSTLVLKFSPLISRNVVPFTHMSFGKKVIT